MLVESRPLRQYARLQQSQIDYQNTVLTAQQQVDNGLATFLQSRQQVGYLRSSVQATSGALNIALEQYDQSATKVPSRSWLEMRVA
jgi:outer membrane protein TolC